MSSLEEASVNSVPYDSYFGRRLAAIFPLEGEHGASVAQTLAVARLALTGMAMVAITVDPPELDQYPPSVFLTPLLLSFLIHSVAIMVAAQRKPHAVLRKGLVLHIADFSWIVALTSVTGGADSPFAALFTYTLLAAGYRWGLIATLATGAAAIVAIVGEALINLVWQYSPIIHLNTIIIRCTYVGLGALLIGFLAEEERRQRLRSHSVARIMSRVRADSGLVASVRAVFEDLLGHFGAPRGLLAIEEEGDERVFLWHVRRASPGGPLSVRLTQEPHDQAGTFMFPLPAEVDTLRISRRGDSDEPDLFVIDEDGGRQKPRDVITSPLMASPFPWNSALCVAGVSGPGWTGRLFVFDPRPAGMNDLRFLQTVVRQVGPALFNLYLQRRLRSDSGVVSRMRIARELHDGVIQSLIGIEMELDVLRREPAPAVPPETGARLSGIQHLLSQEILTVRDLMQALTPTGVDPSQFVEHLAGTIERFRYRTGIEARLICAHSDVDLPRRTCDELAGVLVEALTNVRKHSGARNVLVRLGETDSGWQLVIDDDGKGFPFEGMLTHDELDARRLGPVLIKERVSTIGGRLSILSQPGQGSRLEITIPR
jgi:signal transduction histidine kinase